MKVNPYLSLEKIGPGGVPHDWWSFPKWHIWWWFNNCRLDQCSRQCVALFREPCATYQTPAPITWPLQYMRVCLHRSLWAVCKVSGPSPCHFWSADALPFSCSRDTWVPGCSDSCYATRANHTLLSGLRPRPVVYELTSILAQDAASNSIHIDIYSIYFSIAYSSPITEWLAICKNMHFLNTFKWSNWNDMICLCIQSTCLRQI